jgi:hypothetical protein
MPGKGFDRLIDALAKLELATVALCIWLYALGYRGAVLAGTGLWALAGMVLGSGIAFAALERVQRIDAQRKAGGGVELREGKVHRQKRMPAWRLENGKLVKLDRAQRNGPRIVGMKVERTG